MKITLIREERESGKEAVSTQETDMLMEKLKTENKTGYITELRSIILPQLHSMCEKQSL